MITFNKVHVFSNKPNCDTGNETQTPSHAELEQETKRQVMLAAVQQTGGINAEECR